MWQTVDAIVVDLIIAKDPCWTPAVLWIHHEMPQSPRPRLVIMGMNGGNDVGGAF